MFQVIAFQVNIELVVFQIDVVDQVSLLGALLRTTGQGTNEHVSILNQGKILLDLTDIMLGQVHPGITDIFHTTLGTSELDLDRCTC